LQTKHLDQKQKEKEEIQMEDKVITKEYDCACLQQIADKVTEYLKSIGYVIKEAV